ncbi:MAG: hypothetical protein J7J11_01230 [Desulfurococcales archaeon]|nr:hypothetical protein [Desulfurococcales archaeon]
MKVRTVFDGAKWRIYYVSIDSFVDDLPELGKVLEEVSSYGRVVAVVPNIGLTKTSVVFGTSFQGVKGLALVVEKSG